MNLMGLVCDPVHGLVEVPCVFRNVGAVSVALSAADMALSGIDCPIPYTAQLFEIMQWMKVHGHMNDDHGGLVQYFEALADCEVKKPEA